MEKETAIEKRSMLYKAVDKLRMLLNGMVAYIQRLMAKREEAKKKQARDAFIASAKDAIVSIGAVILPLATTVSSAVIMDRMKARKKQKEEAEKRAEQQRKQSEEDARRKQEAEAKAAEKAERDRVRSEKAEKDRAEKLRIIAEKQRLMSEKELRLQASAAERERHNKAKEAEKERHNRAMEERGANRSKKNKAVDQQVVEAKTAVKELVSELSEKKAEFTKMASVPELPDSSKAEVEKAVKDIEKREQEVAKIATEIKTVETEAKGGADPVVIEQKLENIKKKCLVLRKGVTRGQLRRGPNGIGMALSKQREYTQGANKIKEKWSETSTKGKHGQTLQKMRRTEKVVSGAKDDPAHIAKYQKLLGERKSAMENELKGLGRQPLSVSSKTSSQQALRNLMSRAEKNKLWNPNSDQLFKKQFQRMIEQEKKNNKQPNDIIKLRGKYTKELLEVIKRAKSKSPRRLERLLSRPDRSMFEMAQQVHNPVFTPGLSPYKPGAKFDPINNLMYWPKELEFVVPYKKELPQITITLDDYVPKDEKNIPELKQRIVELNKMHKNYANVKTFGQCIKFWENIDKLLSKIDKIADPVDEEKFKRSQEAYIEYQRLNAIKQQKRREEEERDRQWLEERRRAQMQSQAESIANLEAALRAEKRKSRREKDRKRFNKINFEGGSRPQL